MVTPAPADAWAGLDIGEDEHLAPVLAGQVRPVQTGGHIRGACFAYSSAPGRRPVTIHFDGQSRELPVRRYGAWALSSSAPIRSTADSPR